MTPPTLAHALVAAAAPEHDYEIVAGDLHEEYFRIANSSGAPAANRWYWTQALLSIPSLLSYSRSNKSALRQAAVVLIAFAVLFTMLAVIAIIETVFQNSRIPFYVWVCVNYADAVVFGAILAWLVRTDGLRVTLFASVFLVLCFVIPAVAGHPGSQAPLSSWILLLGAVPVMCIGAGLYQAVRRRIDSQNQLRSN
jgi:hypothetical protein